MQQTQKYGLNLIESSDPFLPEGLNQNTQKIEDAMSAHEEGVAEALDAMDQRVTVLEGHKMAYGSYTGNGGSWQTIKLPFAPLAVICMSLSSDNRKGLGVKDCIYGNVTVLENGFKVSSGLCEQQIYSYLAFC